MKPFLTSHFYLLPLCYIQTSGLIPLILYFSLRISFQRAKGSRLIYLTAPVPRIQPDKQGALKGQQTEGGRVPPDLVIVSGVPSSQLRSRLSMLKSS